MESPREQQEGFPVSRRMFMRSAAAAVGASAIGVQQGAEAQQGYPGVAFSKLQYGYVPGSLARHVTQGDCMLCVIGDSIATDSSTASNLSYGIQRTWRPRVWSSRFGRMQSGPPSWSGQCWLDTFYYSQATEGELFTRLPGAVFGGGEQSISPNIASEWRFGTTDVPDFGPMLATINLNDPLNYAVGDWTKNVLVRGRVLFWRGGPAMAPTLRIRGKRGGAVVAEATVAMNNGAGQIASADVNCGAGEFAPGLELTSAPGVDERGKRVYWFGAGFWRCNAAGHRTPGFGLMQIGEGGWTTADHLSSFRCTDIGLRQYMGACIPPNTFLLHIGTNQTISEANALNAGDHTGFKANLAAIIQRYTTQALQAGATGPIRWLLVNPYPVGYLEVNTRARARAMMELVLLDPVNRAFVDLSLLAGNRTGDLFTWYTVDGTHPTPDGAAYLAGLIWSHIAAAA